MHSSLRLSFNIKNYICTAKWSKNRVGKRHARGSVRKYERDRKTMGKSSRKVRFDWSKLLDRGHKVVRGLNGLAHGPQWNLNPTAPCKGWSYLTTLSEIIFPRTSTLKSPISQLPTMIISKPLTKCKSISQYNLTTQFIRNINVITQVNFNVNQSMFKWWPL